MIYYYLNVTQLDDIADLILNLRIPQQKQNKRAICETKTSDSHWVFEADNYKGIALGISTPEKMPEKDSTMEQKWMDIELLEIVYGPRTSNLKKRLIETLCSLSMDVESQPKITDLSVSANRHCFSL